MFCKNLDINQVCELRFPNVNLWMTYIHDPDSVFNSYSSIIELVCNFIDDNIGMNEEIVLINLTSPQRNQIYRQLSEIGIRFIKNNNPPKSISVSTHNVWTVPFIPRHTSPHNYPIYWNSISTDFYNQLRDTVTIYDRSTNNMVVTIEQFFEFKKNDRWSRNQHRLNSYTDSTELFGFSDVLVQNTVSHDTFEQETDNMQKKLDISDLLFDIKEKITSGQYKELMEKLADIK